MLNTILFAVFNTTNGLWRSHTNGGGALLPPSEQIDCVGNALILNAAITRTELNGETVKRHMAETENKRASETKDDIFGFVSRVIISGVYSTERSGMCLHIESIKLRSHHFRIPSMSNQGLIIKLEKY